MPAVYFPSRRRFRALPPAQKTLLCEGYFAGAFSVFYARPGCPEMFMVVQSCMGCAEMPRPVLCRVLLYGTMGAEAPGIFPDGNPGCAGSFRPRQIRQVRRSKPPRQPGSPDNSESPGGLRARTPPEALYGPAPGQKPLARPGGKFCRKLVQ